MGNFGCMMCDNELIVGLMSPCGHGVCKKCMRICAEMKHCGFCRFLGVPLQMKFT